jgi:hypothetical protein
MEIMDIIKILLPALLVLLTAYLLIDKLLRSEEKRRNFELRKDAQNTLTPIRLRAYERLILVLERTTPSTLIVSVAKPGMTNMELQTQLLESIRHEFSHNLSQQIYVSNEIWVHIRATQESLLRLVNSCSAQCNPTNSASELAERIIQVYDASEQTPTEIAIDKLKNEVRHYLS